MPTADALLDDLAQALLAEERARDEVRVARRRQAELLRGLRAQGLPATRVAHRLAAARGETLPVAARRRLARCLLKRAERETTRRLDLPAAHGLLPIAASSSERAITPDAKETHMSKLVKRTVTEEYAEEKDQDLDDIGEGAAEEDDGEEPDESGEEEKPVAGRRRR